MMSIQQINEVMAITEEMPQCCGSLALRMYHHQLELIDEHRELLHHAEQLFTALCIDDRARIRAVKDAYMNWLHDH
jgi:hypothetical protein